MGEWLTSQNICERDGHLYLFVIMHCSLRSIYVAYIIKLEDK